MNVIGNAAMRELRADGVNFEQKTYRTYKN